MKHVIIILFGIIFLISCGKDDKAKLPKKVVKEPVVSTSVKENKPKEKSVVEIDAEGVANVTITSNDGMRFDIRKFKVSVGQKVRLTLF